MVEDLLAAVVFTGFGLVFAVVGLHTANNGRRERARSGRIADTETTPVRDVRPGPVELKGTARAAEGESTFASPIRGTDALAARVEVEEWESSGQGGGSWETVHEEERAVPMTVDDGTAEIGVELPPEGELNAERTRTKVESGEDAPEPIRRYLEERDAVDRVESRDVGPLSIGERRRYAEGVVEPGEEVYVLGRAREERAGWGDRSHVVDGPTEAGDFVLSDKSEAELIREGKRGGLVSLAFGGLLTVVGAGVAVYPWVAL